MITLKTAKMDPSLKIHKIINIKSYDFNIYENHDGQKFFDLISFSMIHKYHSPKYLVNYYGCQKKYINIFFESYTDWSGMTIVCAKARKYGVLESYKILQDELYSERLDKNIKLSNTYENKIIKEIKEYFGKMYEYVNQYPIKKDGIVIYKIDLLIKNNKGIHIIVEIDEDHHNTKKQKNKDIIREREIKQLYNYHFTRIKYETSDNKNYLDDIRKLLI